MQPGRLAAHADLDEHCVGALQGAVGPRGFWPNAYAGYVRDLDGNKLAAYCRKAE